MMNAIRKHSKIILWIVVFTFVGTIFFVWGMDLGRRKSFLKQNSAAVVNGEPISWQDFNFLWNQEYRRLFSQTNVEPKASEIKNFKNKLIDRLIDQTLLKQAFQKTNLEVFADEIAANISAMPSFQEEGKFSQEKYLTLLKYNQLTPENFETKQEESLAVLKFKQLLENSLLITESEIKEYFRARNRKIKLLIASFDWQKNLSTITPTDKEIKTYFEENSSEFQQPAQVKASHILISIDKKATEEEKSTAKLKLENIKKEIMQGADFADMAKKHSQDPGSKNKGGDLGFFKRGTMVKPFEQAAFSMKKNELSDIVESSFGFHLIKVTDKKPEKKSTLDDVKEKIIFSIKQTKAQAQTQKAALDFMQILEKNKNLNETAKLTNTKLISTDWLQEDSNIPGVVFSGKIIDQALDLPFKKPSSAIMVGYTINFVEIQAEEFIDFNNNLYELEKDSLLEKLKTLRAKQTITDFLSSAKAQAEITNNVNKISTDTDNKNEDTQPDNT